MLDERDLELIGGVVAQAIAPVHTEVTGLKQEVTGLKQEMTGLKQEVTGLRRDVDALMERTDRLEKKTDELTEKTNRMQMVIENELRPNICKIAEGHLDLSRKLDMVRVRRSEYTLLDIKVSGMQIDIREIRNKLKIA